MLCWVWLGNKRRKKLIRGVSVMHNVSYKVDEFYKKKKEKKKKKRKGRGKMEM